MDRSGGTGRGEGLSERELQSVILELAKRTGWLRFHARPGYAPGRGRWATQMSGDKGFPDLVLVRTPEVIFAELKSSKGDTTDEQDRWLGALRDCPGVETWLVTPRTMQAFMRRLTLRR